MGILSFGAIDLRTNEVASATYRNNANHRQAWLTERLQAVTTQQFDPEAVLQWRTRTQIRSRLKNYTNHS